MEFINEGLEDLRLWIGDPTFAPEIKSPVFKYELSVMLSLSLLKHDAPVIKDRYEQIVHSIQDNAAYIEQNELATVRLEYGEDERKTIKVISDSLKAVLDITLVLGHRFYFIVDLQIKEL